MERAMCERVGASAEFLNFRHLFRKKMYVFVVWLCLIQALFWGYISFFFLDTAVHFNSSVYKVSAKFCSSLSNFFFPLETTAKLSMLFQM